ncbi:accessory gene regulator ArgB-like protein [Paenibacillus sp. y28]|uniref:accessory gene regulator ArgB-like protein n=1 Tax=Paenibacillus sp. y28 TaxID=3129110 RepID=UPI00301A2861
MIYAIAEKIAIKIKQLNEEETTSVPVMKYALIGIISICSTTFLTILIAFLTDKLYSTIITMIAYVILRTLSGGFHFKSATGCILFSVTNFVVIQFIPMNDTSMWIATAISGLLVLLYAPSDLKGKTRIPELLFPYLKIISLIVILSNVFFQSTIVSLAFFSQSLTLLPWLNILKKEVINNET